MEDLIRVFLSGLLSSLKLLFTLILIVLPLTVLYEFLKLKEKPLIKKEYSILGISKEGFLPLVTGIVIGLTYGAGIIIHSIRHSNLTKREAFLVLLFLSVCHAIIEDTLIFVVIGANGTILVIARFLLAIILTFFAAKAFKKLNLN
ncbi:MAG: nucleoside recognition protein [Desulfobacterota bacterium]|nr:nucleoside recognition protein [Thermodesulfobacteriota bacterium]MDW8002835.1 nucleoside recognition protein [Deltaproteobacteria bacterium]